MAFDPATAILDIGSKVIDRLWPDPLQRDAAKLELLKMQQTGELAQLASETDLAKGQLAINQIEAGNSSIFVSGARPFFLWVCGIAFGYKYILEPFLIFVLVATGAAFDYHKLPALDWSDMMAIALPLLGIGGMRSYEKVNAATNGKG